MAEQTLNWSRDLEGGFGSSARLCDRLVKVGFGDGQEAAVSLGSDGEYEGLSGEDGQLAHQLARVRHEEPRLLFTVDHPLINVEEARDDKLDAHLLKARQQQGVKDNMQLGSRDGRQKHSFCCPAGRTRLPGRRPCPLLYLISLTSHHRAGLDVMERHSALQQAGVLQQKLTSTRAGKLEDHCFSLKLLCVYFRMHRLRML